MPLDNTRWGPAIAARIRAWSSANLPQDAFVSNSQLDELWTEITDEDKVEIQTNADIDLQASDIPVEPGTFQTTNTSDPITGQGANAPVTLMQRIK